MPSTRRSLSSCFVASDQSIGPFSQSLPFFSVKKGHSSIQTACYKCHSPYHTRSDIWMPFLPEKKGKLWEKGAIDPFCCFRGPFPQSLPFFSGKKRNKSNTLIYLIFFYKLSILTFSIDFLLLEFSSKMCHGGGIIVVFLYCRL